MANRIAREIALFETPNLDGLSVDPGDYDTACEVLGLLSYYAKLRARAMRARGHGRIMVAIELERRCDQTYNRLPAWAKW